jgi:hypothetical protein
MQIIYDATNIHNFPICTKKDREVNLKKAVNLSGLFENKNIVFYPGKNNISDEDWTLLNKEHKNIIDHLIDIGKVKIIENAENLKLSKMRSVDALELIDNTMEVEELEQYLREEKKRSKPRKQILDKINEQIKQLKERFKSDD